MSFVYAEKRTINNQDIISIHCDTKIVLSDDDITNFSVEEIDLIKKFGIVKVSIIGATMCIAFAGNNIFLAAKLFYQLYEMKTFSVEEAIEKAYAIQNDDCVDDYSDIEFIICSADDNVLRIDCIKDGSIQYNCSSAWLGSYDAFREFQRIRMSNAAQNSVEMTDRAFQSVVEGCGDESVGLFHISSSYRPDFQCFWYSERSGFFSDKSQIVASGDNIKLFLSPSDGGFSFHQLPCNYESLIVKIDQIEPMILYSRAHRLSESNVGNPNLFGLMLPMLVVQKENGEIVRC